MNQNNKPQYPYQNRYSYNGGQQGSIAPSLNQNDNNNNSSQAGKPLSTTLLPYHEYMALQKKSISNPTPQLNSPQQQQPAQRYHTTLQPYYYQQQQTYQYPQYPQPYNCYQGQPYNNYIQPPIASYYPPVQVDTKLQSQQFVIPDQNVLKSQLIKSTNLLQSPKRNEYNADLQKQQSRHSPSPMSHAQPYRKQAQPQYSAMKSQQKKPYSTSIHQSNYKQIQQQNSPRKSDNNNNYRQNNYNYRNRTQEEHANQYNIDLSSNQGWSEEQEEQEMLYQKYQSKKNNYFGKSKQITKKKDPVLDDPEEIKRWIEARKRNYPGLSKRLSREANRQSTQENQMQERQRQKQRQEMSKLESKIRKKLIIINGDSRSIMKKIKNIQILRRIVQDPKILKRQRKNKYISNYQTKPKPPHDIEQKAQQNIVVQERLEEVVENKLQGQLLPQQENLIPQKHQSSYSEQSAEPQQLPANKIPTQPIQDQVIEQEIKKPILPLESKLFQFVQKQQLPALVQQTSQSQRPTRRQPKILDPQTIIAHLKQKQNEDKQSLNALFDYKSNSHSYNYRVQTLQTSLKLDQIFAETTYLLQAIRYIAKQNFFDIQTK